LTKFGTVSLRGEATEVGMSSLTGGFSERFGNLSPEDQAKTQARLDAIIARANEDGPPPYTEFSATASLGMLALIPWCSDVAEAIIVPAVEEANSAGKRYELAVRLLRDAGHTWRSAGHWKFRPGVWTKLADRLATIENPWMFQLYSRVWSAPVEGPLPPGMPKDRGAWVPGPVELQVARGPQGVGAEVRINARSARGQIDLATLEQRIEHEFDQLRRVDPRAQGAFNRRCTDTGWG
jgi:hypothetical protein